MRGTRRAFARADPFEQHIEPRELAERWKLDVTTIRRIFSGQARRFENVCRVAQTLLLLSRSKLKDGWHRRTVNQRLVQQHARFAKRSGCEGIMAAKPARIGHVSPECGQLLTESDHAGLESSSISREIADEAMLRRVDILEGVSDRRAEKEELRNQPRATATEDERRIANLTNGFQMSL